jgi:hypothetical protein
MDGHMNFMIRKATAEDYKVVAAVGRETFYET